LTVDRAAEAPDWALPLEYRYTTWLAGCLYGGLALLGVLLMWGSGGFALVVALAALAASGVGSMGLLADPANFLHAAGRKLIVTDTAVQEIDEKGCVHWCARPDEILHVSVENCRLVFPWAGTAGWRAEVWVLLLKDGRRIRIPIWLLPGQGARFRQRFSTFLKYSRLRAAGGSPGT